ncbi:MAG: SWIM zinc finger family protein [Actinomycetia bacterium]|nr:SWIM zinc finger family protein [Actinomycetes bacterium]
MNLADVLSAQAITALAGPRVYPRGVGYHTDGRVELNVAGDRRMKATVRGSVPYAVELWIESGELEWSCTCPYAEDGAFCKHCVAVALQVVEEPVSILPPIPGPVDAGLAADVSAHIEGLSRERLIEIVLGQCERDWRLRERMAAEARYARGEGPDRESWRRRIDAAFALHDDVVVYREAAAWASEVDEVIDALEDLAPAGHQDAVIELAEHAHRCAEAAIGYVDDSDGWISSIEERLSALHLSASEAARPDPVVLARRLVDLELTSELDGFHRAAATYAGVLGEAGLAEYRRIVEPRWEALIDTTGRQSGDRFAVEQAMIGVALGSGDVDELIEVRGRDLRSPAGYLEIARALARAGRIDDAVEWAKRGLAEYPDRTWQLPELRDFLAGMFRSQGSDAEAVELYWQGFDAAPSLSSYRQVLKEGESDGAAAWSERCLEMLKTRVAEKRPCDEDKRSHVVPRPAQALVDILMYEGDVEDAWTIATEYGCDNDTWMTLARAREATYPLGSIAVYEREVLALIDRKKNHFYRAAVDLLERIRVLADVAGQPERFTVLLERVRTEHRAKRNLKALLDNKGW